MKPRFPFLILAAFSSLVSAHIDPLVLVKGNTWSYHLRVERGPTVKRLTFDGISRVRIDSVRSRNDSLLFWTTWTDSSAVPEARFDFSIGYAVVNGTVSETGSTGTRLNPVSTPPWFMLGSDFNGKLEYVSFDGGIRFLNKWGSSLPPMSFGTTIRGAYLQGIGLVSYSSETFGSLAREGWTLDLMEHNGEAFDSTKMVSMGSAPLEERKVRGIRGAKPRVPLAWKGQAHGITGRRLVD